MFFADRGTGTSSIYENKLVLNSLIIYKNYINIIILDIEILKCLITILNYKFEKWKIK